MSSTSALTGPIISPSTVTTTSSAATTTTTSSVTTSPTSTTDSVVAGTDRLTAAVLSATLTNSLSAVFGNPLPTATMDKLLQLVANLKKGDVLFIGADTAVTSLTDSKWTHAAICSDPGDLSRGILPKFVEAEGNTVPDSTGKLTSGVIESNLDAVLSRYASLQAGKTIDYKLIRPTTDQATIDRAVDFARSKMGAQYDFSFNQLDSTLNSKWYCSELVFEAYKSAGLQLQSNMGIGTVTSKTNAITTALKCLGATADLADEMIKKATSLSTSGESEAEAREMANQIIGLPGFKGILMLGDFAVGLAKQLAEAIAEGLMSGSVTKLFAALEKFKAENLQQNFQNFDLQRVNGFMPYPEKPVYNPPAFTPPPYNPPAYTPPSIGMLTGSYPSVETIWHQEWWGAWPEFRTVWNTYQYPNPVEVAAKAAYDTWYAGAWSAYHVDYNARNFYYTTIEYPAQRVAYDANYALRMLAYGTEYGIAAMANASLLLTVTAQLSAMATVVSASYVLPNAPVSSEDLIAPSYLANAYPGIVDIQVAVPSK